jgi:hypothetical protein
MWLRRLVGIMMILTCIGLNILTVVGLIAPSKTNTAAVVSTLPPAGTQQAAAAPTVTISAQPSSIQAGSSAALNWSTTGNPSDCTASDTWSGSKTPFGSESTGRLANSGNFTFTLTCQGAGGKATASTTVTVGNAPKPAQQNTSSSTPSPAAQVSSYCSGRIPCYGPREVGQHGSAGNCWGWNGVRVINITGFDAAFHMAASGVGSIQMSQICGHDLAPALSGQVEAGGKTRDHNATTKQNAETNEIPYFVGYFDNSKP